VRIRSTGGRGGILTASHPRRQGEEVALGLFDLTPATGIAPALRPTWWSTFTLSAIRRNPKIFIHEDVPAEIISDEEAATLVGWPVEKVRLPINPEELEREVIDKYRTGGYGHYRYEYGEYG